MKKISVLAITKNGITIGSKLKDFFPNWKIYAPEKFFNNNPSIEWFSESSANKIADLFKTNDALICLFSLGAVIRLLAPYLKDKKSDPAVIVIDDKMNFVISVLSGHLGGANQLSEIISKKIDAVPVITTAADVNKTISVDLVGRELGWIIEDESNVTRISAMMVNEEKIGVYQDVGLKTWWKKELPKNVRVFESLKKLRDSKSKGYLVITDKELDREIMRNAVVYRPPSLVVGVGLHWDTSKDEIERGLESCLKKFKLSKKSVMKLVSIKKSKDVKGLIDLGNEMNIPVEYVDREDLAKETVPNPSHTVQKFEGTSSVSEAAAIKVSKGELIVEKQKFPPNLTIAIARKLN